MRVTTKGRYGLRAMVDLAKFHGQGPILMGDIANHLGVSRKYLHALLTSLKSAGLVYSVRGSGGGYYLAREPKEISIAEIMNALEGPQTLVDCVRNGDLCERSDVCVARDLWTELGQLIDDYFAGFDLEELANRLMKREKAKKRAASG